MKLGEQTTLNENMELPEGAVSVKVKKLIKTIGNVKTTKIIKIYKMKDGSEMKEEEIDEEFI